MPTVEHTRMSSASSNDDSATKDGSTATTAAPAAAGSDPSAANSSRFAGAGVDFKGKLIGVEEVSDVRGDKMCQVAMVKLKAGVKAIGDHKQRITINVSLEGVKIIDEKSSEILHQHEVGRISFIARDPSDNRAFGYVYRRSETSHQFFGIKTEKPAEGLVLSLRDLFQAVYEAKKKQAEANKETNNNIEAKPKEEPKPEVAETKPEAPKASTDIMDLFDPNTEVPKQASGPEGGLSPSLQMLDPWGSGPSSNHTSGLTSIQQLGMTQSFGGNMFPQPGAPTGLGGSPFFPQVVQPVAMVPVMWPSTSMAPGAAVFPPTHPAGHSQQSWGSFGGGPSGPGVGGHGNADPFGGGFHQQQQPGTQAPTIPARRTSPGTGNPFGADQLSAAAPAAGPKKADPFAELDMLGSAIGLSQPYGKKVDKKDFFQEPAKPSLFDLTQQPQQQQQPLDPTRDLFGAAPFPTGSSAVNDPFA